MKKLKHTKLKHVIFSHQITAIHVSLAFNIDVKAKEIYEGKKEDYFGYKVAQFGSGTNNWIIVTAPLQLNGSGGICKPSNKQPNQCFNSEEINVKNKTLPVQHLGLSIAADSTGSQFTVCSPSLAHGCNENSYLNSVCYKISDQLVQVSQFIPDFQECTKKTVDLVFLFDGSGSMREDEFTRNKYFINDIMDSLKNTSIKFAAVQFSSTYRKVFDFNDYEAGRALDKLKAEQHMKTLTNTHKALRFVLEDIMENPASGASRDATKVLVLITDGDPSDTDRHGIINTYDEKSIIRFVIGVKDVTLDRFTSISSAPTEKYAFKIENYDGLKGILENFQKRIFKIEGEDQSFAGDLTGEMSQGGFSLAFNKDALVLGSVGYKSWQGALQEFHDQTKKTIEDPHMQNDSYMGYSLAVGEKNKNPLYFSGAPRFNHTGLVVLFKVVEEARTVIYRESGKQIGSYFGAELCLLDINSDSDTDFLLVGAPMLYHPQQKREGQVYVYELTDKMELKFKLDMTASMGRFGTTISSLADLNGDGLRDVAVGAPLEDDNRGAVYIYLGDRHTGIRKTVSQRIMGNTVRAGLRFFGQAIDGGINLKDDRLPDIVIGSQGSAVVLRSRPVVNVTAHLSFSPKEISIEKIDCVGKMSENLPMVTLTVCFEMVETTRKKTGAAGSELNITYTFNVDPMRQTYRGFVEDMEKARIFTSTTLLTATSTCLNHTMYMPKCVKDTYSPLVIKFNFSQVDSESGFSILNIDSKKTAGVEIPFEKQCAKNDTCIAELEVDFNFTTPTLLVMDNNYINIIMKLSNHGDDSYNTSLIMYYPEGLSFSWMTVKESTRPILHGCDGLDGVYNKTICGISLPVYRSRSAATFNTTFYVITKYAWNETVNISVAGRSDNANNTERNLLTKSIPVQFGIGMALTVGESTSYLNFTTEDASPKKIETVYKIANLGLKSFPVFVSFVVPTKLQHDFELINCSISVQENKTHCKETNKTSEAFLHGEHKKIIECDPFTLEKDSVTSFTLSANVQFRNIKIYAKNITILKQFTGDNHMVLFKSSIRVKYDKQKYVLDSHKKENRNGFTQKSHEAGSWKYNDRTMQTAEVRVELIILQNRPLIISTGVGLGLFLLIIITVIMWKLGCFKRKTFSEVEEDELYLQTGTEGKSDQPPAPEQEKLLDDGEALAHIKPNDHYYSRQTC
uniref:Integrin alpha-M-like n=1 Tax=Echeneis naucrates TaxID=173247 RepID=A0A665UZU2_ECHNA